MRDLLNKFIYCLFLCRGSKMDGNVFYVGGNAIKMFNPQPLTTQEVEHLFEKFGEIKQIVSQDDFQIIYFDSEENARKCVQQFQCEATTSAKADPASTGDRLAKNQVQKPEKTKRTKKIFHKMVSQISELYRDSNEITSSPVQQQTKKANLYIPNCSSPVLLNTMDPGFRLAYCHDVQDSKTVNIKPGRLNQFSESIMKYMDGTPRLSSQELVLTNLPPNIKKSDVYELCGNIEPEAIELKKTSNIDVLYANIKTKTDEDFDKLMKTLGNCQINGVKITTIPITKVENSPFHPSSEEGITSEK